ncbi:hypothetical protein RHGRI_013933 [Rhododendron griersonianum]|uniref:Uncharacterized protein n=1 Tax=Rhododendron griersonianum TaxID=479676 RepID=A0AAV6K7F5_9ERIC|nr:hypothetical protein RHGRI_013933 [Rhododendron griersonianum]
MDDDHHHLQQPDKSIPNPSFTASDHSSLDFSPSLPNPPLPKSTTPCSPSQPPPAPPTEALTKPLNPTQDLVTFNPTYDQLWAPINGPSHPYAKDGLTQGMRNHKLGFVKYVKKEDEKRGDREEGVFASTTDDEFGSDQVFFFFPLKNFRVLLNIFFLKRIPNLN